MYRRPKFLEVLLDIRQEMAREADYDVDLFAEIVRHGDNGAGNNKHSLSESAVFTAGEGSPLDKDDLS
jgi:hypothetical protein